MLITPPGLFIPTAAVSGTVMTLAPSSTNILSNGNLTVTYGGSGGQDALSSVSHSAGKYYYECTLVSSPGGGSFATAVGITGAGANGGSAYLGNNLKAVAYWNDLNDFIIANGVTVLSAAYTTGDTDGFAIDIDNKRAWVRKNGGLWNVDGSADPATNVGGKDVSNLSAGALYVWVEFFGAGSCTLNFGGTAYANAAPSGFGNW